jgi:hypothetical protein
MDVDALLRVGGLAPPGAAPREPADPVTARRYRHPALGDRPVVRLVAGPMGRAEDLALEPMGFELASESEPVALARRRALGFPAWVLLHHPDEADYALAVVEEMEALARLARSRPGAAKDGYEEIGRRLARTVPHFLPTYFEEAGRAFVDAGSASQAGVMFGKAREAERVYALEVDEDRRLAVFLEFALAGALTARSLASYAEQLRESNDAGAAHATFRRLCVERARAGVPPWADMATQLRRLGSAASLEGDADERVLLAELLESPALARAPLGFWRAYRRPLLDLARSSPAARGVLLDLQPGDPGIHDWWLGLLDSAGALDAVTRPAGEVDPLTAPRGGAAAWLGRTVAASTAGWRSPGAPDALFALLPRMARRLRVDAMPIRMVGRQGWQSDLDLLDLAIELGLPVEPPGPDDALQLRRWLNRAAPKRRDLEHVAAHAAWGPLLVQALDSHLHRSPAAALLEAGHLRGGFSAWLERVADRVEGGGLPDLADELGRLTKVLQPGDLGVNPAARDRILRADAALSLARTLRGGCLDELGWPVLEAARARLGPDVEISGAWPNLVLSDGAKAIVAGPDAVLLEHDLRIGPALDPRQLSFLYTGGQLLVCWWIPGTGRRAYWSGRPGEVFDPRALPESSWAAPLSLSLELPDGSRTSGSRSVRPGDTTVGAARHLVCDGTRCWTLLDGRFHQLDPATGRTGAASLPEFLAAFDAGGRLVAESSWLMPLPAGVQAGPLGGAGGLVGVRARRADPGGFEAEGTDGRRVVARLPSAPVALVTFPGDDASRPVTARWQRIDVWDPTGRYRLLQAAALERGPELATATPVVPPPAYWLALRPRDEAGSVALRGVSDEVARALLRAPDHALAVQELLPAITHPDLRRSVAGQAEVAAKLQRSIDERFGDLREGEPAPAGPSDTALLDALAGLVSGPGVFAQGSPAPGGSAMRQLAMVDRFMAEGEMPAQFVGSPVPWPLLAGRMAAAGWRAASPATAAADRDALVELLARWAGTVFAQHPERFRVVEAIEGPDSELSATTWLRYRGGRRWFISRRHAGHQQPARRLVLERAHRGGFELPPDMTVEWERAGAGSWESPQRVRRLLDLVAERGPAAWVPERVDELVRRTGLTRAEAALLLAGLPLWRSWQQAFLPGDVRRMLGLKVSEAAAARDRLSRLPVRVRIELAAAPMPDDPADLWRPFVPDDPNGPAARIASTWLREIGRQPELDDSTVTAVRAALGLRRPAAEALTCFTDPGQARLSADARWRVGPTAQLEALPRTAEPPFDGQVLHDLSLLIPWLFASRPVGDGPRSGIPEALRRAGERMANPELLVAGGWAGADLGGKRPADLVPGPPYRPPGGAELAGSRDAGAFVLVAVGSSLQTAVFIRPARMDPAADAGPLGLLGASTRALYRRIRFLTHGAVELAQRVDRTPLPAGSWEANPAASAPEVVAEVAGSTGLSREAAVLYLQLLAAPDPTVRGVRDWNGWSGPTFERAAAELADRRLAVRARRPRAGRDVFLPGPWEDLKAPDLPVESWCLRFHENRPLGRLLALRPLHRLFADAWAMVQAGDGPAFEEIPR